jgi:hypothetical protein
MQSKFWFCVDIETDGPLIEINPLRSIGAVVVAEDLTIIGQMQWNIEPHGVQDKDTMKWWAQWPKARAALSENMLPIDEAIKAFDAWCRSFVGKRKFVTDAPWFDWAWMRHHLLKYTGDVLFDRYYPYTWIAAGAKINLPRIPNTHPHVALYDAEEMALQLIEMRKKIWAQHG